MGGVESRRLAREQFETKKQQQEGLWELESVIQKLRQKIENAQKVVQEKATSQKETSHLLSDTGGKLKALQDQLRRRERELVQLKDAMDGTEVWQNITAHTVPKWLRDLKEYDPIESDHLVYTNLDRVRKIVLNPSVSSVTGDDDLLALQTFFMEKGMVPHVQQVILRSGGIKTLLLLGTIGGGKHVWRGEEHWNPFGKRLCAGGPRAPNATLVGAGCRMLMGVTRCNGDLRFRWWRAGIMKQLVVMGLLMLRGDHVEELWAVLQALKHFGQGRNEAMSDGKPEILREGGLQLMLGALRRHPLHFGIKRECLDWAHAMITGRSAAWKVFCKDAMRLANVTQVAQRCCDVSSHCQGGKRTVAISALTVLQKKLGQDVTHSADTPTRKLTPPEVRELWEQGCLPDATGTYRDSRRLRKGRSADGMSAPGEHERGSNEEGAEEEELVRRAGDERESDDSLEQALMSLREGVSRLRGGAGDSAKRGRARGLESEGAGEEEGDQRRSSAKEKSRKDRGTGRAAGEDQETGQGRQRGEGSGRGGAKLQGVVKRVSKSKADDKSALMIFGR